MYKLSHMATTTNSMMMCNCILFRHVVVSTRNSDVRTLTRNTWAIMIFGFSVTTHILHAVTAITSSLISYYIWQVATSKVCFIHHTSLVIWDLHNNDFNFVPQGCDEPTDWEGLTWLFSSLHLTIETVPKKYSCGCQSYLRLISSIE